MNKLFKVTPLPCLLLLPNAPHFTITDVNIAYLTATRTNEEDLIGKGIFEAFPDNKADITADGVSNLSNSLHTVVATKKPHEMATQKYDIPVRGSDKFELRYWDSENVPVLDDDGEVESIIHTVKDVTEKILLQQKKNLFEQAAISTKELLDNMFMPTKTSTWEYNIDTDELHWSDEYFRMCGYEPQSFAPTIEKAIEIIHPDDRELSYNSFIQILKTGSLYRIERRIIRRDGEVINVLTTGVLVRNGEGEIEKITGLSQNITGARQMEMMLRETIETLRDRNNFIETILQNIPIGIAVNKISDGKATLINDKFSEIYGWDNEDFDDIPSFFAKVYPEENYRNEITKQILEDIASGDPERMQWNHVKVTTNKGEQRIINAKNIPLFSQDLMISTVLDVTQQKQEELRLKLFKSVVTHTNDIIVVTEAEPFDEPGPRIVFINEAYTKVTGYTFEEVIGNSPRLLQGAKTDKAKVKKFGEAIRQWKPAEITVLNYKKNGEEMWMNISVTPVADEKGWYTHWVAIQRDVTAQRQEEERKALFVSIVDSSDDAIISKTLDSIITSWNKGAEKIFSYTPEEVIGKNISLIIPEYLLDEEKGIIEKIKRGEAFEHYETERLKKDGSVISVSLTVSPLHNIEGNIIGASNVTRDITERKKAETAIRESNERYDLVAKATHDSIWDWDITTGVVTRTGEGFKSLFGYDNSQGKDYGLSWIKLVHPNDLPGLKALHKEVLNNPNEYYLEVEYRFLRADGNYAYVYDKGYVIRNEEGKAVRMIGATKDITDLKKSTTELEELNTQLLSKAEELTKSNIELEQFAYIASHDLQEPLRMVTSFLSLIERKYADIIDENGKKYIHFAVDGAMRMRQIILDLLEFSRVGRTGDKEENVNLNELISEIELLLGEKIKENKATITVSKLPDVYACKVPFRQIFQNLIGNALKYSKPDVPTAIDISVEESRNYWKFAVKDNGIGINKQFYDKIFVIFQRLHNKNEFSGTGVGLAVTKKIIEGWGGKIWVESEEGKGSEFYFTIQKSK